jgi:hypothetical protein
MRFGAAKRITIMIQVPYFAAIPLSPLPNQQFSHSATASNKIPHDIF